MAEAHQGVAFTFSVTEDDGLHLNVSLDALKAVLYSGLRSWRKRLSRLINEILNGFYPSHPWRGMALFAVVTGLRRYKQFDLPPNNGIITLVENTIPRNWFTNSNREIFACFAVSSTVWLSIVAFRKYSLQTLFSYHGWMYQRSGKTNKDSLVSKIWLVLVKLMVGRDPQLFSYQSSMPGMPVPNLNDTIRRYLRTVRPLLDDENYNRIKQAALDFQNGPGPKLQRYLKIKSYISSNYVSDWWEEYVYLRGRSPIMVNSNFYALDCMFKQDTKHQAARAANIVAALFIYRREIDNQTLRPMMVQNFIPLCSAQYERQFNTTRIPGEISDKIVHEYDSKHIAVYCHGKWYKLYTYYQSQALNAKELEIQVQKILDDKTESTSGERHLGALTAGERVPWAQARTKYFSKGVNKTSLTAIEKAAFVLCLDEEEYNIVPNEGRKIDGLGCAMLHGSGFNRWFDKSFNVIITKDAKAGMNIEHSWADAPISAHMWEHAIIDDHFQLSYDAEGHSKGNVRYELPQPQLLKWDIKSDLEQVINSNLTVATDLLNDVDLHIYVHDSFGKGVMKKARVSPDAFIQMALQLAYFRDIGRNDLTYEASMTRMFREGRTETIRSCSVESSKWVKAMCDSNATIEERKETFKVAAEFHVQQIRDAMTGKGVDRHIFCLYVVSKYLEIDIPFLHEVLGEPWRLSTSQTPSCQTNKVDLMNKPEYLPGGGGFGPVSEDGYGVSYMIMGENAIIFHVSSKKKSGCTDSYRFAQKIREVLFEMKALFETPSEPKKEVTSQ